MHEAMLVNLIRAGNDLYVYIGIKKASLQGLDLIMAYTDGKDFFWRKWNETLINLSMYTEKCYRSYHYCFILLQFSNNYNNESLVNLLDGSAVHILSYI